MADAELYRKLLYQHEVLRARLGIREHYLKTIVKEVYENIGQVLSLVRVQLTLLDAGYGGEEKEKIDSSGKLVGSAIRDLRHLCQRFQPETDITSTAGFNEAIGQEIKSTYPDAVYSVQPGSIIPVTIGNERALILFNLLLEVLSVLGESKDRKFAEAVITYRPTHIEFLVIYTGEPVKTGRIKSQSNPLDLSVLKRVELLDGSLELKAGKDQKRKIKLVIPIN